MRAQEKGAPTAPGLLLVAQPTREVDIGAAEYIHQRLIEQRDASVAVQMISEDLDEVMAVADRIVVMYGEGHWGYERRQCVAPGDRPAGGGWFLSGLRASVR